MTQKKKYSHGDAEGSVMQEFSLADFCCFHAEVGIRPQAPLWCMEARVEEMVEERVEVKDMAGRVVTPVSVERGLEVECGRKVPIFAERGVHGAHLHR